MTQQNSYNIIRVACVFLAILFFSVYILTKKRQQPLIANLALHVWYTWEEKVHRPLHFNHDHGFCGSCPEDQQVSRAWQLIDLVSIITSNISFLVNIGAASSSGGIYDPTYPILISNTLSFGALLVDPNSDPGLFNAYPNRSNIRIIHDFIWTESIIENIFIKYDVPKQFAVLKVDIDSYECSLLEKILSSNYRPQIIHTEFNPVFPPPVIFMPIYNSTTKSNWRPSLWTNSGPFYGCSLTALSNILKSYDYVLVEVDFWDVIYIERDLVRRKHIQIPANDEVAYEHGFINHSCFAHCRGNPKLYNPAIDNAIKFAKNQSNFSGYMKNMMAPIVPKSSKNNDKHPYIMTL